MILQMTGSCVPMLSFIFHNNMHEKVWGKSLCYSNGSKSIVEYKIYSNMENGKKHKEFKSCEVFLKHLFVEGRDSISWFISLKDGYGRMFAEISHNVTIGLGNIRNTLCPMSCAESPMSHIWQTFSIRNENWFGAELLLLYHNFRNAMNHWMKFFCSDFPFAAWCNLNMDFGSMMKKKINSFFFTPIDLVNGNEVAISNHFIQPFAQYFFRKLTISAWWTRLLTKFDQMTNSINKGSFEFWIKLISFITRRTHNAKYEIWE